MDGEREQKNVLVLGATGFIGSHLCERLAAPPGTRLHVLSREGSNLSALKCAYEKHVGDVTDYNSLLQAMQGMNVVFHLAAVIRCVREG